MVYEVPKSKASIKQNRFEFTFPPAKKVYSIPLLKFIRPALIDEVELMGEVAAMRHILKSYFPTDGILEKFEDADQFEEWCDAWSKASGIDVGESEASLDS